MSTRTGLTWKKSSYSGTNSDCVETATGQLTGHTPVRDSKRPTAAALCFGDTGWGVFVGAVKAGTIG